MMLYLVILFPQDISKFVYNLAIFLTLFTQLPTFQLPFEPAFPSYWSLQNNQFNKIFNMYLYDIFESQFLVFQK